MELRQLEYFIKIADTGSVSEAARRLNMSQPPLSYQLRRLEEELNVRLLTRTSRGVELTEAGRLLYRRASSLIEYARSTRDEVSESGKKRILRMGITSTTVPTILPAITRYARSHPDVNFEVHDGASMTLLTLLLDGIIDVSVARTPLRLDEVESLGLGSEGMIAVSPPDQLVEREDAVTLEDLTDEPLILYRRYEELIMNAFARKGLKTDVFCICDDARDAMLWVGAGLATAIFPRSMSSLCTGLRIRSIAERELETQTVLIWKKDGRLSPTAREFIDVCAAQYGSGE
jgi:LysR family transcriptional regulator, salicylic acid-responsive activator of bsdBCD